MLSALRRGRAPIEPNRDKDAVLWMRRAVVLRENKMRAWYRLAYAYHWMGYANDFAGASTRLEQLDPQLAARLSNIAGSDTERH